MGIVIWKGEDVERLRRAGKVAAETLATVIAQVAPGMRTSDIDRLVRDDTKRRGGRPSQLGYNGFPAAVCTSVNDVVCHGIPSERKVLSRGDIVNVDVTTEFDGFHGDTSATVVVGGETTPEAQRLVEVARQSRDAGIAVIRDGARLGDIGGAITEVAGKAGYSVVSAFQGHGIGRKMHAEPGVPHVGKRGTGKRLVAGMAITVEPMINIGGPEVFIDDDDWTVRTRDGSLSAQWEHTILVTREGYEILTML